MSLTHLYALIRFVSQPDDNFKAIKMRERIRLSSGKRMLDGHWRREVKTKNNHSWFSLAGAGAELFYISG